MLDFLEPFVKALGPDVVGVGVPLALTHVAKTIKAISSRVPKAWGPWIAMLGGAAGTAMPGMPDIGAGITNGLVASGLYGAGKMLYPKPRLISSVALKRKTKAK